MKQNDDLRLFANAAAIVVIGFVAGAVAGQAPAGFLVGCIAAVFYFRKKDDEQG
jgi:hypothetical protein